MNKKVILIFIGMTFLLTALFFGTPFEFLNSTADTIANFTIMLLFLLLFILLFRQISRLENKALRWITLGLLIVLAIPYLLVGLWTTLLTASNYHPMWQDVTVYSNDKGEKVISQWRETSGSIYDYRDRKIIADFGQFRISFDCNIKDLKGTWTEQNIGNASSLRNFDNSKNFNWVKYTDTVNVGFIMTFKYPDNLVAESIENGRCVGEPIKTDSTADSDVTNTMRWCIWMNDTTESESIESLISSEKHFFKGHVVEQRESIMLNDIKALRVTFKSDNQNDPYRQMVYFKKYSTLFEIVNNYGEDKNFKIFYNSLTIDATKKKPSH